MFKLTFHVNNANCRSFSSTCTVNLLLNEVNNEDKALFKGLEDLEV